MVAGRSSIDVEALAHVNTVGIVNVISFGNQAIIHAEFFAYTVEGVIGSDITNDNMMTVFGYRDGMRYRIGAKAAGDSQQSDKTEEPANKALKQG